jgi:hypothetical protein
MATVEYLGGIPELRKTGKTNVDAFPDYLAVFATGFSLKTHKIPYEKIKEVVLSPEGTKKKKYVLYVDYDANGFESRIVFSGDRTSALYGSLQKARSNWLVRNSPSEIVNEADLPATVNEGAVDIPAEIERYHDLKERGIITEEEFTTKKNQLLNI